MNLFGVLDMEPFSLQFLLISLIIGVVVLIILEKRNVLDKTEVVHKDSLRNTTSATLQPTQEDATASTEAGKDTEMPKGENSILQPGSSTKDVLQEPTITSSSCSSSGSEEEASRPLRVSRRPKKKHACKGSAIKCATKRKVTAVTIVTDSQEEEVKVSLEDLAGEIRSHGVTCDVHPAVTHVLPPLSTEPSHLLLLFGTMSKGCKHLQESLTSALGGDAALPPPQPFLYSVTCWSATASGDVYESARELSASLQSCGGAEWLPITCITTAEGEGESEPPVMARQQYVKTVMDKLTKPGKKCCGTSCGSKTVDIEDLASSLLLPRAAVTS